MIVPTDEEEVAGDVQPAIDAWQSRMDDLRWAYVIWRRPFSWQWFVNWWVARRWLVPRDHAKR